LGGSIKFSVILFGSTSAFAGFSVAKATPNQVEEQCTNELKNPANSSIANPKLIPKADEYRGCMAR
jgi:hypothetical protein